MNHQERNERFDAIVQRYGDDLYRFAVWLCRDPALAADLVQETCLRAWKALHKLQDEDAAKSWLITILRREFARTFERKVPDFSNVDDMELADLTTHKPDDSTELRLLRQAMMDLDPKYREPILLQVLGGFSCDEIADQLGITRSAVMTQLFRAREKLKVALRDAED